MLRMVLGLFVSIAVARYLGPKDFGLYNYVLSIVALVAVLGNLGLRNLAKRELVATPEERDEILGTCFVLSALSGMLAYGVMLWIVAGTTDDSLIIGLFALIGGQLFTNSLTCTEIWFQSQVRSDLSVRATSISLILYAGVKIAAIASGASLIGFAYIFLFEAFTVVGIQLYYYFRNFGSARRWKYKWSRAQDFLYRSWPLMLSGFAGVVYMKIDQVMLGSMVSDVAVGEYAVASRISSIWYFVPHILSASLFPAIFAAKKKDKCHYLQRVQRYFDLNVTLAYGIALPLSISAPFIILLLFGKDYQGSSVVLAIHAWTSIFVFMGIARNQYLIAENLLRYGLYCNLMGAAVNVALNWFLIPIYGISGAAFSTLISHAVASFLSSFIVEKTVKVGIMQAKAYLFPFRLANVAVRKIFT